MISKMFLQFITISLMILGLLPDKGYSFAYPYERMELVYSIEKEYKSLSVKEYKPLENSDDRIFLKSYWKIYYQQDKIVGEELFEKGRLTYYYVYFYDEKKVYQKGFFWYGIYRDIGIFRAHEKRVKQGWMYKDYPNSYRVYDKTTNKLIYEYYYPTQEIARP